MEFFVLGPLDAHVDGCPLAIGPPKQRAVLALLLMRAGTVVPVEAIVDELWPDDPPRSAVANVRSYASRLGRALTTAGRRNPLGRVPGGYLLDTTSGSIDATAFAALTDSARAAGDPAASCALLAKALDLWRGPSMAVPAGPALSAWQVTLDGERIAAIDDWASALVSVGDDVRALTLLRGQVSADPLRERSSLLLMQTLYRRGEVGGALAEFDRIRRALAEAIGVDPGPDLVDFHRHVLARNPAPIRRRVPPRPAETAPAQLPAAPGRLVGRHSELATLDDAVDWHTRIAMTGAAGVGKTALALAWAQRIRHRYPDGQLYADLAGFGTGPAADPQNVLTAFLQALAGSDVPVPAAPTARAGLFRTLIADRRVLIVLDNAADVEQVRPLLPGGPAAITLIISRRSLVGLVMDGAVPLEVCSPSIWDATDMLLDRIGPDRVAAEPDAAAEIVRRCDCVPLAIAALGARIATHPEFRLRDVAAELQSPDAPLGGPPSPDLPDPRTALSWSYRLLSPDAATLFRALHQHPDGDLTVRSLAEITGQPATMTRTLLSEITDLHLVRQHSPRRFSVPLLTKLYSAELDRVADRAGIPR